MIIAVSLWTIDLCYSTLLPHHSLWYTDPVLASGTEVSALERPSLHISGGEGDCIRGGGAGLAGAAAIASRVGGAGQMSRHGATGGASLDHSGEEWEGLTLRDTPIRRVGVANASLDGATALKSGSKSSPPGGECKFASFKTTS